MIDLLNSIIQTITSLVQFLINTITSLIQFLLYLPSYMAFLTSSINVLPSIVLPFVSVCIILYVVLFIINRR